MSDPMSAAEFDALLDRAGVTLPAAERAEILEATRHVLGMAARLRMPPPGLEAEPALTFAPLASPAPASTSGQEGGR